MTAQGAPARWSRREDADLGAEGMAAAHAAMTSLTTLELLADKPEETTHSALRALWHLASGDRLSAAAAMERPLPRLDPSGLTRFHELVKSRVSGTPLAHLTERQRFMGLEMVAGPGALIPRRETEIVARAAVDLARRIAAERDVVTVVDVCTGSGNVAAAIATSEPRARVYASDLSEAAVKLARRNMEHLGVGDRVTLRTGDLLAPFDTPEFAAQVDLLTCNPPYISSGRVTEMPKEISEHEPRLAFDGGPLGVRILQRLIREAPRLLRVGGWLAFEVGLGQGPSVAQRLRSSGTYADVSSLADEQGQLRVLMARAVPPA